MAGRAWLAGCTVVSTQARAQPAVGARVVVGLDRRRAARRFDRCDLAEVVFAERRAVRSFAVALYLPILAAVAITCLAAHLERWASALVIGFGAVMIFAERG